MTAAELRAWRQRLNLSRAQAAEALGLKPKSYSGLEEGRAITSTVALLTEYVERDRAAS